MAKKKPSLANIRALREASGENQGVFWKRFGVTQSGGSRYESGRTIPLPIRLLIQAWIDGLLDDATLVKLQAAVIKRTS